MLVVVAAVVVVLNLPGMSSSCQMGDLSVSVTVMIVVRERCCWTAGRMQGLAAAAVAVVVVVAHLALAAFVVAVPALVGHVRQTC